MNWKVWDVVERILLSADVKPILAVVPENRDPALQVCAARDDFWDRVRVWHAQGWTIAVHGWQHRFVTNNSGILGINQFSEFAGLTASEQEHKLRCARQIFEQHGIEPWIFVAPAHSFDKATLQALREVGFSVLSDGFYPFPRRDRFGMIWVPQQLWSFKLRVCGVWTVCSHINSWSNRNICEFEAALNRFRENIADVRIILNQYVSNSRINVLAGRIYRSALTGRAIASRLFR
jgi:hypothetical protein